MKTSGEEQAELISDLMYKTYQSLIDEVDTFFYIDKWGIKKLLKQKRDKFKESK